MKVNAQLIWYKAETGGIIFSAMFEENLKDKGWSFLRGKHSKKCIVL